MRYMVRQSRQNLQHKSTCFVHFRWRTTATTTINATRASVATTAATIGVLEFAAELESALAAAAAACVLVVGATVGTADSQKRPKKAGPQVQLRPSSTPAQTPSFLQNDDVQARD